MSSDNTARYGVLADVHANLQALEAALAFLDDQGVDEIWCLGDVVGYGGDPVACVNRVRERCSVTVRGNHDAAVGDVSLRSWFNPQARAAIELQAEMLDDESRDWLAGLPRLVELPEVALLHASASDPESYPYVTGESAAALELRAVSSRWTFYGHTHVAGAWRLDPAGGVETIALSEAADGIPLAGPGRYLVNPGSVGQPRDRDPRAACAVFERPEGRLRHARLAYDVAAAQHSILDAGMPAFEAQRLARGV